tara:strand:- start:32589 stop:33131 length:543 start_codon:yes stop_codon:yes gene_type:complete
MLDGLIAIELKRFHDDRGYFYEIFNQLKFDKQLKDVVFVQDNLAFTKKKFTFRGLHQQRGEYSQAKLVSVISGSILDIAVDIRKDSKTFGKHSKKILSEENNIQLYIPEGFLHGYLTLSDDTTVTYKTTSNYMPQEEMGVNVFDGDLKIELPCSKNEVILSPKDLTLGSFIKIKEEIYNK